MYIKKIFLLVLFLASYKIHATELFDTYRSARAMGMGGAYTSIAQGLDSLFYNPASLADIRGFNLTLLNTNVGATEIDDQLLSSFEGLQDQSTIGQSLTELFGKPLSGSLGARSGITLPGFAVAGFAHADLSITVNNPVIPDLDVNSILDAGVAIGFAKQANRFMNFGVVLKQVSRYGDRQNFTASSVATLDPQVITDALDKKGTGLGFDAGIDLVYRGHSFTPKLSVVAKNIGGIKFNQGNNQFGPPPDQDQEIIYAGSFIYDAAYISLLLSADYRYALSDTVSEGKKIHLGAELSLPMVDLRAGLNQGYLTYGVGVNLGIFRLDAASYGLEIGEKVGQLEARRYTAMLSFDFGFEFNSRRGSRGMGFTIVGAGSGGKMTLGSGGGRRQYKKKYYKNYRKQRR